VNKFDTPINIYVKEGANCRTFKRTVLYTSAKDKSSFYILPDPQYYDSPPTQVPGQRPTLYNNLIQSIAKSLKTAFKNSRKRQQINYNSL
jgi:hypothetical protein